MTSYISRFEPVQLFFVVDVENRVYVYNWHSLQDNMHVQLVVPYFPAHKTRDFLLEILEKNNDECILILVIDWKKTGLLHTKISNHNKIYSS